MLLNARHPREVVTDSNIVGWKNLHPLVFRLDKLAPAVYGVEISFCLYIAFCLYIGLVLRQSGREFRLARHFFPVWVVSAVMVRLTLVIVWRIR